MKTTLKKAIQDQEGGALVLTLVLLMIGGLIMAPLFGHIGTGHIAGQVHEVRMEQLYTADAGVEDAVWRIQNPDAGGLPPINDCADEWVEEFEPYELEVNGVTVVVSIDYLGDDKYRVLSTTAGDDSATAVESYVYYGSHWKNILDYGIVALDGDISITGTSQLDSYPESDRTNIYAHGNISIGNAAWVRGDATATGTIDRPNKVTGIATQGFAPITFTLPDLNVYEAQAQGELIEGNLDVQESRSLGPARITGDLNLSAQAVLTLTGVVWVEGRIVTAGGSEIKGRGPLVAVDSVYVGGTAAPATEQMPVIISTHGPIDAAGTQESFMVLYAPNGMITIQGNAKTNGAAVGKEVTISISAQVRAVYDLEVVNRVREPHIRVLTWEVDTQ